MNLKGGPAMEMSQMRQWRQKHLLGASLKLVAPTGQYDPTKLINLGGNRWAIKPELGYSGRFGHWILDAYASVWFFTRNPEFFSRNQYVPGTQAQTQKPMRRSRPTSATTSSRGSGSRSTAISGTGAGRA